MPTASAADAMSAVKDGAKSRGSASTGRVWRVPPALTRRTARQD